MASRAQLVAEIIKPALETGKTVLCDRFISSTCAYQGSSGYSVEKIIELGKLAVGDVWPDLTIIIDIPVEEGLERTGRKPYQKTKVNHEDANQSLKMLSLTGLIRGPLSTIERSGKDFSNWHSTTLEL
jgi:dTMP kinase